MKLLIKEIAKHNLLYPKLLHKIHGSPPRLFISGKTDALKQLCIAIVGTRKATNYGLRVAEEYGYTLASAGITVVSGLAYGIDSAAHKGAIRAGGKTIAVLGSGLHVVYPHAHKKLAEEITKDGLLISEFEPNTPPQKYHFPLRNRIIGGISVGVIVIEAKEKSGALITAHSALDENRDIFAIPGSIYSENSKGTHQLLLNGAQISTSPQDILDFYQIKSYVSNTSIMNTTDNEKKLTKMEQHILKNLTREPKYIDLIVRQSQTSLTETLITLSLLEQKGLISQNKGYYFIVV